MLISARKQKGGRSHEELDGFIQEKFRAAVTGSSLKKKTGEKQFTMRWQHEGKELCREGFAQLFGIPKNRFDKCSREMKANDSMYLNSINHKPWTDDHVHDFKFTETEELFKKNLRDLHVVDEEWVQAALSPTAEAQQYCIVWFKKYFDKFGDRAPNRFETYLIITARRNVYQQYVEDCKRSSRKPVLESVFSNLWNTIFPRYMNRPWCDIPGIFESCLCMDLTINLMMYGFVHTGKCDTCYEIDKMRRTATCAETQKQLKVAHHLHRGGLFNLERLKYKSRCDEAIKSNARRKPSVMSLIIDGMDQNACKVPHLGGQDTFAHPLKQHFTGVKEHGVGLTIYRNFNNVAKGADLTIYCVLRKLEEFKERYGYYPEKLFLQCDGGSENANKFVLAMLELLVVKRCCREVYFTRLPTGHTHEDIDAAFAIIGSCFEVKSCETVQQYKDRITAALQDSLLNAEVEDVLTVPDYCSILKDCIAPGLSRLHKDLQTQHQWRFLAVKPDVYFPLGCKTTYRAYSSDRVVEFIKQPKNKCYSKVGRYTGLEPVTVYCRWYPSAECDANRVGVEGFYLLTELPAAAVKMGSKLKPCPFVAESTADMHKCFVEVHKKWQGSEGFNTIILDWVNWKNSYCPNSDDSDNYIIDARTCMHYKMPMRNILFDPRQYIVSNEWLLNIDGYADYDPNFQWPEMVAKATNSVASNQFNPRPLEPRIYSVLDDRILESKQLFCDETALFYEVQLSKELKTTLQNLLRRRVFYSGEETSLSGNVDIYLFLNKNDLYYKLTQLRHTIQVTNPTS